MRWLLALVLLVPGAQAGVPFEIELDDPAGDVIRPDGEDAPYPSADIRSLVSRVADGRVEQRIRMEAAPRAPEDTILLRSWFHNSTNGSFWTIDMEVRGFETNPEQRFHPIMRRGDFFNATFLSDATYALDGDTWVFTFAESWVADGTCFDPGVFSRHIVGRSEGADALFLARERRCLTAREPDTPAPPIAPVAGAPPPAAAATPTQEAPGSRTPTPGAPALVAVAIGALALALWRRRA